MKKNYTLRFRQIHLDYHTSECIPGVGAAFKKKEFQAALKAGHVDSITVFSKCHHGWSYHPTKVGKVHPTLDFDLLGAQIEACREIDVNTPVYLSAGLDSIMAHDHPEWRMVTADSKFSGWGGGDLNPGFKMMCFNTPYLDYLCDQIREVVKRYPKINGIFLDIIFRGECCCARCMDLMEKLGLDATVPEDRRKAGEIVLMKYYEETTKASRCVDPAMPVFHNSGHVGPEFRNRLPFFSHLELESLPTGGWGYDHYPLSAKYVTAMGLDYLGMTGKFHTSWGEFGGFKHPNALKYECAAMLAFGSKCSVGDQLHPNGKMDESTYALIGEAYADVEKKEPWCRDVKNVADIGLLMAGSAIPGEHRNLKEDVGAGRILLEGHFLFDIIDPTCDFTKYRMVVVPDTVVMDAALLKKLKAFAAKGGKLFLTGASGLDADGKAFLFDVGAKCEGAAVSEPDYVVPREDLRAAFVNTPLVMYKGARRIKATKGTSLGHVYDSYFNRHYRHFCSHQHTPNKPKASGYDCGVLYKNILYLAHPVFSIYADYGAVAYKDYILSALRLLLGDATLQVKGLPSTGRVSLLEQPGEKRTILHALYAPLIKRGNGTEIIEELLPIHDIAFAVTAAKKVKTVQCVPDGAALPFTQDKAGTVRFTLPTLLCHQIIAIK
ncbi:MAG: beta-galactosidase trimerization domain-containing protein [Kiritimatiellaeota bacterium]|nr:beta-galactosidase trimerization domain-containing protein [Kiritimatiellota bacterium]